jgi:hypothetical protein
MGLVTNLTELNVHFVFETNIGYKKYIYKKLDFVELFIKILFDYDL